MDGLSRQIRQRIEQINQKLSEAEKDTLLGGIQKLPEFLKITSMFFRSFEIIKDLGILGVGGSLRLFGSGRCMGIRQPKNIYRQSEKCFL